VFVWLGVVIWPKEALEHPVGVIGVQLVGVFPSVAANGVGELAALLGVVCLVRVIYSPHRVCYGMVFAFCCGTLILSQTRSAVAGFACGGWSILIARKQYFRALIIAVVAALALSTSSADSFWSYIRRGQDTDEFTSLSGRTSWWTVAIERIKERPILGYGAYSGGRFVVLQQLGDLETTGIHNDYLEILLGTGVVGLSVVVVVLTSVWSKVLRASQWAARSTRERAVTVEAIAVLTLLMIRSIFSSPLFWHPPLPFLLVVGYAEILRQRGARRLATFSDFTYARAGSIQLAEFHLQKS
jgi:O-antigen ligase